MQHGPRWITATLTASALLLTGCTEDVDGPTGLRTGDAGESFRAVSFTYETPEGDVLDLISDGASFTLDLDAPEAAFRSRFDHLNTHVDIDGSFRVTEQSEIVFSDDPFLDDDRLTERALEMQDDGTRLTFRDVAAGVDLDNDGFLETAALLVVMERD